MMLLDNTARLLLSPVLITQALSVRKRAQSLPEASGDRRGSVGTGEALRLRIIGDSSAAGVGAETQQQALAGQLAMALQSAFRVHWELDAITGATTRSTMQRLQSRTASPCDVIVIALGVNDVTRLIPPRLWLRSQQQLHSRLRELYAPRIIYLSGIPPIGQFPLLPNPLRWTLGRQAQAFDRLLSKETALTPDLTYVPFEMPFDPGLMASDGFHPAPQSYALWANELAARIRDDWPKRAKSS